MNNERGFAWTSLLAFSGACASAALWVGPWPAVVVGTALAAGVVIWAATTRSVRSLSTAWKMSLLGLLATAVVGLFPSVDARSSLPKLQGILLGIAIFGLVLTWLDSEHRVHIANLLLLATAMIVVSVGLIATDWPTAYKFASLEPIYDRLPRMLVGLSSATRGIHANKLAAPLAMLAPVAVAGCLSSSARRSLRVGWGVAAVLVGLTLVLTQSRSACVAAVVALVAVLVIYSRRVVLPMAPLALAAVLMLAFTFGRSELSGEHPATEVGEIPPTLAGRLQIWSMALRMIGDFPFTGIGLGTFPRVADALYTTHYFGRTIEIPHAHSLPLQVALDLGLPGLACFSVLTVCLVKAGQRALSTPQSACTRSVAAGAACGLLAYYVYGAADVIGPGEKPMVLYWLLLGIVVGSARLRVGSQTMRPTCVPNSQ